MIDKNDVKMPVQKEKLDNIDVKKIEDLLDSVNSVDNKQELRLKSDYYSKFHWFGVDFDNRSKSSYFSYQEEAVYDFVFTLNKSGILSDQVGMGKTIEAGMIISELAGRNELRSLLIVVPNEIMAQKWEYELQDKFGIRRTVKTSNNIREEYPEVKVMKNFDDFCEGVYVCVANEKFSILSKEMDKLESANSESTEEGVVNNSGRESIFSHKNEPLKENDTLEELIKKYIQSDIKKAIDMVNEGFSNNDMEGNPKVEFDGKSFKIINDNDPKGEKFVREYNYDKLGKISQYIKGIRSINLQRTIASSRFTKQYHMFLNNELKDMYILIGHYITTMPKELINITTNMTNGKNYPILVIPISYSEQVNDKTVTKDFLNRTLLKEIANYQHSYVTQNENGDISEVHDDYRIIDFFIDASYQTLIVDEVHDYIDVCAKVERTNFHNSELHSLYSSKLYNRYELFDDYYFIDKNSLYKKLKNLADKANRKIFLTATPIKSDMIDFYLLTLIASNKDSEIYKKLRESMQQDFATDDEREEAINELYNSFKSCIEARGDNSIVGYFTQNSNYFFKEESAEEHTDSNRPKRLALPYFHNSFLTKNINSPEMIRKYLLSQMSYLSMEEMVLELILSYNAECGKKDDMSVVDVIKRITGLLDGTYGNETLQTKVVFRSLLNNTIKLRFEEDFTKKGQNEETVPIKRIRELLELEDGPRMWHKTYRKYGIRHTRHQTYNLTGCENVDNFSAVKRARYKNLPVWPKREGKVIFLSRDDVFFDSFLNVKRDRKEFEELTVRKEELPNYDKLKGSEEEKQRKFENAVAIFDYINNSMSGGDSVYHEPQNSKYESIELDDSGMVDYKLALVTKLMLGDDIALGQVNKKVLLFAENNRDEIIEWFKYQKCTPIYNEGEILDDAKMAEYKSKWTSYNNMGNISSSWRVSENTDDLDSKEGNLLVIIDPKRYEKGVDLQKADTIINFDINYCPLKMEQRIGRIDRIRPAGRDPQINIISFVPLNDMSGYVINFFANELKMFTQWMGETTGIVSVPEDAVIAQKGEDVSFEGKVGALEKFYKNIYKLCRENVSGKQQEEMAEAFREFFKEEGVDLNEVLIDFGFINLLREPFNKAFMNSLSPERQGYKVDGSNRSVMRFNSTLGTLMVSCSHGNCSTCPNAVYCNDNKKSKKNNVFYDFKNGVEEFFKKGTAYYKKVIEEVKNKFSDVKVAQAGNMNARNFIEKLENRQKEFMETGVKIKMYLNNLPKGDSSFTVEFDEFAKNVSEPMKIVYWDTVVNTYIDLILNRFHKQCDSVLQSAKLFEKFIKVLSIADFMNNMEVKQD